MTNNTVFVTRKLLSLLKVKNTRLFIEDAILSHPDQSSLLSVSDVLNLYNLENIAIKVDSDKLNELPLPLITQVKSKMTPFFYVLNSLTKDEISYYKDSNTLQYESRDNFLAKWTGVCLLAEKSEKTKEPGIEQELVSKRFVIFAWVLLIFFFAFWSISSLIKSELFIEFETASYSIIYTFLKVCGLIFGVVLLWFEVDQYNPKLQSFCSGGKKVDCNSVLNSDYAKLLYGTLNLSLLGFSYFFGSFFYLLLNEFSSSSLTVLTFFSFLTFPVIFISVYFQAIKIKQWCKFCIGIQIILLVEIFIGFLGGFYKDVVELHKLPLFLTLFIVPILVWKFIKPLLEKEKETNLYRRGLKKIKNNPDVLNFLLSTSRKIETPTEGLGISIKSDTARYSVIKVCNPYCGPCASAHPILEQLVNNGKINLQVLFTSTTSTNDQTSQPVRHFLALNDLGDSNKTQEAMNYWYHAKKKDYAIFAKKYPMNGKLEEQNSKIKEMSAWCTKEEIIHTPTIFINGYELPNEYSVKDLIAVLM